MNNLVELKEKDLTSIQGGWFPIVVFGIKISAECVTALFVAGVAVGATATTDSCN